jgi:hypothetical protein
MKNDRQPVLDALQVDAATAIELAELNTLTHGKRPVNQRTQKRILQVIGSYRTDDCYLTAEAISKRIAMDERTVRAAIRALVADGMLLEWGPRNRRHLAVHWTEIGRRIPRLETVGRRHPTAAAVSQGAEVTAKSAGPRTHTAAPVEHPQGDHTVTRGVHCEPAKTNAKGTRPDHSPGARSGQCRPIATGQSADNCPDDPGNRATIARIIPDNRTRIARLNRAVAARTYKEQENNLTTSSSQALAIHPPAGGNDDDEGSLTGCTSEPAGWTPKREAEVTAAMQDARVHAWRESIENAKSRDIKPDAVLNALFVAMNHRDPRTGNLLLGAKGFVAWTRAGSFPCENPPTAAELRERIAAEESRKREPQTSPTDNRVEIRLRRMVCEEFRRKGERPSETQIQDAMKALKAGRTSSAPGTTPGQVDPRPRRHVRETADPRTHAQPLDDRRQHDRTGPAEDPHGPGTTPAQGGLRDHRTAEGIANADAQRPTDKPLGVGVPAAVR